MTSQIGRLSGLLVVSLFALVLPLAASAQTAESAPAASVVPQQMRFNGVALNRAGDTVEATFHLYANAEAGEPLWTETQRISIDRDGNYSVVLGAATEGGLPQALFAAGQPRWLGISIERASEKPRLLITSVAYAMKAADAETLAGIAASEFVTQNQLRARAAEAASQALTAAGITKAGAIRANATPTGSGIANTIPIWKTSSTLGSSMLSQSNGIVVDSGSFSTRSNSTNTPALVATGTATTAIYGIANSATSGAVAIIGLETATNGTTYGVEGAAFSAAKGSTGVWGVDSATKGEVTGVRGEAYSSTTSAAGVFGRETARSGTVFGVFGETGSAGPGTAGVLGSAVASVGQIYGVSGVSASHGAGSAGVIGSAANSGQVYGVSGSTASATNGAAGVYGNASAAQGAVYGVQGVTASGSGVGVYGEATSTTNFGDGVVGSTYSPDGVGIAGLAQTAGAVAGQFYSIPGSGLLLNGLSGKNGTQVFSVDAAGNGAFAGNLNVGGALNFTASGGAALTGTSSSTLQGAAGVTGFETSTSAVVYGVAGTTASATNQAAGVFGNQTAATGDVYGVYGQSISTGGAGVYGGSLATSGYAYGVYGTTASSGGAGVYGINTNTASGDGIVGTTNTGNGTGIFAINENSNGTTLSAVNSGNSLSLGLAGAGNLIYGSNSNGLIFAVDPSGNVVVAGNLTVDGTTTLTGTVSKPSGSFKIDDPLDPAHKYLYHSFVESPDMMNVYNGNVTTDKHGVATVTLPDYFEALNRDFRYQLTVIGQFAQAIIAEKISGNRFVIRTSKPRIEVSWQITGIRQDAYANANRIPVEEDKPAGEQGTYLHPEVFGQPASRGVNAARAAHSTTAAVPGSR